MKRISFFLAIIAVCVAASAQQPFTLEQVMSGPFSDQLIAAKDAPRIAWVTNLRGSRNVYVADAPDYKPRQVTRYSGDNGQPIAALTITPDGKTLLYARGTEVNGADKSANPESLPVPPKQQVWAVSAEGGEPKLLGDMGCAEEGCEDIQISPDGKWAVWVAKKQLWGAQTTGVSAAKQLTNLQGSISEPQWSPGGASIAFRVNRDSHSLIAVAQLPSYGHDEDRVEQYRWISPSADRDLMPRWSPDGTQLTFIRTPGAENRVPLIPLRTTTWAIYVAHFTGGDDFSCDAQQTAPVEVNGKMQKPCPAVSYPSSSLPAHQIWRSGAASRDSLPEFENAGFHFATDGRITFVSEQDNWPHLYSIPSTGGQPTLLTQGDYSIEDVVLSRDRKSLIYTSNEGNLDSRHVWRVPLTGGTPAAISKGDAFEFTPVEAANGDILSLGSSANTTALPLNLSAGRAAIAASLVPADFPTQQLLTPKLVTFPSSGSVTVHGQLFLSAQCEHAKCPGIIFTHGGPPRQMLTGFSYMYYYSNAYAENQYLASRGYIVLSVNYRNGIMYGHDFQYPSNGVWRGAVEYDDVVAGGKYLQSLPQVDPARIGLWGGSYGGFLTAMGLAHNSDIFKAGVDFHGVHDWSVFLPQWEDGANSAPDLKEAIALAIKSSPVGAIETWRSPVLLIHGDDDRNVPFGQTTDLVQRLKKQKVSYEELIFPDEIHDLLLWRDWIAGYRAADQFFNRHLKAGK